MSHTERIAKLEAENLQLRLKLGELTIKPAPDTFAVHVICGKHMYAESGADHEYGFFESVHGPCTRENQRGQIDAHTILSVIGESLPDCYRDSFGR